MNRYVRVPWGLRCLAWASGKNQGWSFWDKDRRDALEDMQRFYPLHPFTPYHEEVAG